MLRKARKRVEWLLRNQIKSVRNKCVRLTEASYFFTTFGLSSKTATFQGPVTKYPVQNVLLNPRRLINQTRLTNFYFFPSLIQVRKLQKHSDWRLRVYLAHL